jgi:hypothetical protein
MVTTMDNNSLQPSQSDYSYPAGLSSGINETMPPLAPSYKGGRQPEFNNSTDFSDQQTLSRLMDSVHEGRMEEIHIGQYTAEMHVNEAHIVNGSIEIQARITPKSALAPDNSRYGMNSNPAQNYNQPNYFYPPQYPYQPQYQMPYPPPYQSQPQYPYQPQFQYPYPTPVVPTQYPLRLTPPTPYVYQYPLNSEAGNIANAFGQLALITNLFRR